MPPEELVRLTRRRVGARPSLSLGDGPSGPPALPLGRAHELCGPARMILAAMIAGRAEAAGAGGPVLWIRPAHAEGRLNPDGLAAFFDPGRLVLARPQREADVLWLAEEALRSGVVPVVIAELAAPSSLTRVRRLHLAAEAGSEAMRAVGGAPLALLLSAGTGGAQGVETRWALTSAPGGMSGDGGRLRPRWRLELLRARLAPPRSWRVRWRGRALAAEAAEAVGPGSGPVGGPVSRPGDLGRTQEKVVQDGAVAGPGSHPVRDAASL
jgi:protein ImuA